MVKLCWYFFNEVGYRRIDQSQTMNKYQDAYYEAADKLKNYEFF